MKAYLPLGRHLPGTSQANLQVRLFYSGLGVQFFNGLGHRNGLLLTGGKRDLFVVYRRLYSALRRGRSGSFKAAIVARKPSIDPGKSGLAKYFKYEAQVTLSGALKAIEAYRDAVEEENRSQGRVSTTRTPVFAFLELNEEWENELQNSSSLQARVLALASGGLGSRLVFWLVADSGRPLPLSILEAFDFSVFLGRENMELARALHPDLEEQFFDEDKVVVGLLRDVLCGDLRPIHHLALERSDFRDANDKIDEIEEVAYQQLLDSL